MNRRGDILDTLVFLLVAILLPMWLLGHLYLMWYPNSAGGSSSSDSGSLVASTDGGGIDGADASEKSSSQSESGMDGLDLDTGAGTGTNSGGNTISHAFSPGEKSGSGNANSLRLEELEGEASKWKLEADGLKIETGQLQSKINQLQETNQDRANTIKDLNFRLNSTQTELEQARQAASEAASKASNAASMAGPTLDGGNNEELESANQRVSELVAQIETINASLRSKTKENLGLKSKIASLKNQIDGSGEKASREMNALSQEVARLKNELQVAQNELTTAKDSITSRESELEQLRQQMAAASSAKPTEDSTGELRVTPRPESSALGYRDFVSQKGQKAKLAFVRWEEDKVVVRSFYDQKLYRIPVSVFSDSDQEYLRELQ